MKKIIKLITVLIPLASIPTFYPIISCSKPTVPVEKKCLGVLAESKCNMTLSFEKWDDEQTFHIPDIQVSTNNGKTWKQIPKVETFLGYDFYFTIEANAKILLRGNNPEGFNFNVSNYSFFSFDKPVHIFGNIMGLLDNGKGEMDEIPCNFCFAKLFESCHTIQSVSKNLLPAKKLKESCYMSMFYSNVHIVEAPDLPCDNLTNNNHCYSRMFMGCTRLERAPKLPAKDLSPHCYSHMFSDCVSLETPPELPALTLTYGCYESMFQASGLKTLPKLDAENVADFCYDSMFCECNNLNTIDITLPANTLFDSCYRDMFHGCEKVKSVNPSILPQNGCSFLGTSIFTGMFMECKRLRNAPSLPWANKATESCFSYMFSNCVSLQYPPKIPLMEVEQYCYESMFDGCVGLKDITEDGQPIQLSQSASVAEGCYKRMFAGCCNQFFTAPILHATTLSDNCYESMFEGCQELNKVSVEFTNWEAEDNCTLNWLKGCAANGTFECPNELPTQDRSDSLVPTGWEISHL